MTQKTDILKTRMTTINSIISQLNNEWDDLDNNKRRFSITINELEKKESSRLTAFNPMIRQMLESDDELYFLDLKEVFSHLVKEKMIALDYKQNIFAYYITLKDRTLIEMAGGKWLTDEEYNFNKTIDAQCKILSKHISQMNISMRSLKLTKISQLPE